MALIFVCKFLECASNSSIGIEVLADHAVRCKRTSHLFTYGTNIPVLGELTADRTVFAKDGCALSGFFDTCTSLRTQLDRLVARCDLTYLLSGILMYARRQIGGPGGSVRPSVHRLCGVISVYFARRHV